MAGTGPQNWIAGVGLAIVLAATTAQAREGGEGSGLAVPRFVSLKSDKVNVRSGPTKDHDITWMYTRAGLPVEITAEYENWRRVRDWEGALSISNNILYNCGFGITVQDAPNAVVSDNTIASCIRGVQFESFEIVSGIMGMLNNNTITECTYPIYLYNGVPPLFSNNTVSGNQYQALTVAGIVENDITWSSTDTPYSSSLN